MKRVRWVGKIKKDGEVERYNWGGASGVVRGSKERIMSLMSHLRSLKDNILIYARTSLRRERRHLILSHASAQKPYKQTKTVQIKMAQTKILQTKIANIKIAQINVLVLFYSQVAFLYGPTSLGPPLQSILSLEAFSKGADFVRSR